MMNSISNEKNRNPIKLNIGEILNLMKLLENEKVDKSSSMIDNLQVENDILTLFKQFNQLKELKEIKDENLNGMKRKEKENETEAIKVIKECLCKNEMEFIETLNIIKLYEKAMCDLNQEINKTYMKLNDLAKNKDELEFQLTHITNRFQF